MVRLSTLATSTFTSELKVRSTVFPDSTFFSLDRTTAPPLPGLWCWNQMTCQSWPSRLRTMPFLRSFVVAMRERLFCWERGVRPRRPHRFGCPDGRPRSLVRRPLRPGIRDRLPRSAEGPLDPYGHGQPVLPGPDRQRPHAVQGGPVEGQPLGRRRCAGVHLAQGEDGPERLPGGVGV